MDDKIIGIVGGMGPQAGAALFNEILANTTVKEDQQHLSVILMSFPKDITDRTAFLEGKEKVNPAKSIVEVISKLEYAGAKIIGLACNTSYSPEIYDVIIKELKQINSEVQLLNMPIETCKYIRDNYKQVRRIGLMTTNGTYKTGLYKNILEDMGYEIVIPDLQFQENFIHKMIYDRNFGIKSNTNSISKEALSLLDRALGFFSERKADAIILGCTELSLILKKEMVENMLIIDSTQVFAKALIRAGRTHEIKCNSTILLKQEF
ncbi:aspartate/glutamate racemase family protein [Fulvivirga ligni]|uniref:aspartate/glutamate racemase family protein n=1 Tax=Fulvivirga ligni TaxID=2904246 RepID=UPI001F3C6006|nr:amino acid racemase [Fulvivirga ligni]UII23766.1 amino acid racemase [Fulvivirga ligni]